MNAHLFRFADTISDCVSSGIGECKNGLPKIGAGNDQVKVLSQLAFMVIGVIAVVVIMLAGFKLIISNGDPQGLAKARQTLIYAVVGLMVAVSAELIIGFVLYRV